MSDEEKYVNHILLKGVFLGVVQEGKSKKTDIPYIFFNLYTESNVYPGKDASTHKIKATGYEFVSLLSKIKKGAIIKISGCLIQYINVSGTVVAWVKVKKIIEN